jgi:hypothetical protein
VYVLADKLLTLPLQTTVWWEMQCINSDLLSEVSSSSSMKNVADVALKKYEDAIMDWNASKALFPLARFDPFQCCMMLQQKNCTSNSSCGMVTAMMQSEIAKMQACAL